MDTEPVPVLTIDEAAARLGFDAATVFDLVAVGELPNVYWQGQFMIPERDVEGFRLL